MVFGPWVEYAASGAQFFCRIQHCGLISTSQIPYPTGYLSRSATLSLHVTIDHRSERCDTNIESFYRTLYTQSHRFASFFYWNPMPMRLLTSPDFFDFSNLRHLAIALPASPLFYFFSMPALETCCIQFEDCSLPLHDKSPPIQCPTNLRELVLQGRSYVMGQMPITAFQLATAPLTSLTIDNLALSPTIIHALPQTHLRHRSCVSPISGSVRKKLSSRSSNWWSIVWSAAQCDMSLAVDIPINTLIRWSGEGSTL
ncbi:hypothetical protein DFS33DRAFT_1388357 [Desarmillaria ectypa]|nr:hypothetical protein DFS33DRAFT_1388357 [Desarmillaria ectypa]